MWRKEQDPDPNPLVRGIDPRIHTKKPWIRNTENKRSKVFVSLYLS